MKKRIGTVVHYWTKIGVAAIKLYAPIHSGDDLLIVGSTTYQETKADHLEIEHQKVTVAEKGQLVAIKTPLCRVNDEVYQRVIKTPVK